MPQLWIFLLVFLLSGPAWAQWRRILISGKGASTDTPAPHPLSYFTANPFLRDDAFDFCGPFDTPACRAQTQPYIAVSQVRAVGSLAGFKIVDVLYRIGNRADGSPEKICWKSILVETAPGRYTEIYHLQQFYIVPPVTPSKIVRAGGENILTTFMWDGGVGGGCFEAYWWFDSSGPHPVDFTAVTDAVRKAIPPGAILATSCPFDVERQEFRSGVQKKNAECRACGVLGDATARFRLVGARAEPTEVKFTPEPQ